MDIGNIGNTFIIESGQQFINAIELFELGYFDCAYYSLRSAVDLSTTMIYLADMPDEEKDLLLYICHGIRVIAFARDSGEMEKHSDGFNIKNCFMYVIA